MRWRLLLVGGFVLAAYAQPAEYDLVGQIIPEGLASVHLHGATTPFSTAAESDLQGRFHFRKLLKGTYTLVVYEAGRGEVRRTVEVGPSLADSKGRVSVTIDLGHSEVESGAALERRAKVSVGQLSIPKLAWREYEQADKNLERRDAAGAVAHLERAVEIAPAFSPAWNRLGTIAYQTGRYAAAEADFRKALQADPEAFEPLVNLGGVLISLGKLDEALKYNLDAVHQRPNDALANSQLGMAYYYTGRLDAAEKYLTIARQIDPAHFSHPQRLLAEIYFKRNQPVAAAAELEDLLKRHPDLADAAKIRDAIAHLKASNSSK